jgi:hypothetical protein
MGWILCAWLGHRWHVYLVRGDYGEAAVERCDRCWTERSLYWGCRCLGKARALPPFRCHCEFDGFVAPAD